LVRVSANTAGAWVAPAGTAAGNALCVLALLSMRTERR
jgi:hypothetical protein